MNNVLQVRRSKVCDMIGALQSEIAVKKAQLEALQADLEKRGPGPYEGDLFRCTVSVVNRKCLDMDAVRAKLSPQFIAANTYVTESVAVKCVARNNAEVPA